MWLVVSKGMATLKDLETSWSLDDLVRAVDYISVNNDIERIPPGK